MVDALLQWPGWDSLTILACVIGFFASATFVIAYLLDSGVSAWRNPFGRFLLTRKALLAVLFALVLSNRYLPDWEGRRMLTALLMIAFALQTFVPYHLLRQARREEQLQEASHEHGHNRQEDALPGLEDR